MKTVPEPKHPRPVNTPAAQAFADWFLTADVKRFNNIGLDRIAEIWGAAWEAAMRARAETPVEPTDAR